nr:hypothetical protein CFP56_51826 [Quercus suber]
MHLIWDDLLVSYQKGSKVDNIWYPLKPAATVSQRTHCRDLNGAHWNLFILNIPAESQSTNNWIVALLLIQWISFYREVETETLTV